MSKCKQHNGNSGCSRPITDCFYCWEAFITNHPKAHIGADDLLKVMQGFRKTIKEEALKEPPTARKIREEVILPPLEVKDEDIIEITPNKLENGHIKYLESVLAEKGDSNITKQLEEQLIKNSPSGNGLS